jgi:hypothetical protein
LIMKVILQLNLLLGMGVAIGLAGCSAKPREADAESNQQSAASESPGKAATNREAIVILTTETQQMIGLKMAVLAPASHSPEVRGFGRVLDALPLAALVSQMAADQTAGEVSAAELKRLRILAMQTNASDRALQSALAAAAKDQAQVQSNQQRLVSEWGPAIAQRQDLLALANSLVSQESALVRIDLPAGDRTPGMPVGARISLLTDASTSLVADFLAPATVVDPQTQGRGFLFLVPTNQSRLLPGAAVAGALRLPGEPITGVVAPDSALIRHENQTWLYVQKEVKSFVRRKVALNQPLENSWFIADPTLLNERVVVAGAQSLLSEELKARIHLAD